MDHLLRNHAPITENGWSEIDDEARARLGTALAARKLVDFLGPFGFDHSARNLGRVDTVATTPVAGATASRRRVQPLVELRMPFVVSRAELLDIERGAADTDFTALDDAAAKIATAENIAVFSGWQGADIVGITAASVHEPLVLGDDYEGYPTIVARAVEVLRNAGISGPYGLALGPEGFTGVAETAEHGGHLLLDHLRDILGGPVVWAPGVEGGVVLSLRGGDFIFESGEDLSIGYDHHDATTVHLYLEETFTFQVASADAAIALTS